MIHLEKNKCEIQTRDEFLCNVPAREIKDEEFLKIKNAYSSCLILLWIEEKFNIISGNYYDWEEEIKENYNFFIENQNSDPDCDARFIKYGSQKIVELNRKLNNLLSSIRLYQDQTYHELSSMEKRLGVTNLEKQLKNKSHELYDESLAYQILELMRNHMQHQGLIIERITAIIPFNRKIDKELWYFVETSLDELRMIEKYDKKIKSKEKLEHKGKWINLIGLVREYYNQINRLHNSFRDISARILEDALKSIEEIKRKYYNDSIISQIDFHGKGEEPFADFLLQVTYIDRIKKYRSMESCTDESRYYINKKVFIDESKLKVSNSARCSIRYNM